MFESYVILNTPKTFRYNYNTKHMNYVFEEQGKKYHSLGLTTKKYTRDKNKKWHKNMPLDVNAKSGESKKSYIRYGYITQNQNTFGKIDKRFKFANEDKQKVKSKIRYFKNQRRKKQ